MKDMPTPQPTCRLLVNIFETDSARSPLFALLFSERNNILSPEAATVSDGPHMRANLAQEQGGEADRITPVQRRQPTLPQKGHEFVRAAASLKV